MPAPVVDGAEGWPAEKVFGSARGPLSLDEIVFLPGQPKPKMPPANLTTKLTRNISLNLPVVGGPSAEVVEADMAIALALMGGIGVIHRHQPATAQAEMVRKVKQCQTGFILTPQTLGPRHAAADAARLLKERGCGALLVTENGRMGGKLVGLVTPRDLDATDDERALLSSVMEKDLVFATEPVTLREATEKMQAAKVGKLPIVNKEMQLVALICRDDVKRVREHPQASRDANKQLLVAAAVSASEEGAWERVQALIDAGVDVVSVDTDEGVSSGTVEFLRRLKTSFESTDVIAGGAASRQEAKALCDAGADALRVGTAPGGATATAMYELAAYARSNYGVHILADCGARNTGQALKALCLGASSVAFTELLAGTEESPGDHLYRDGVRVKLRGHPEGQRGRAMAVGTLGRTVDKGSVATLVPHLMQALRSSLRELAITAVLDLAPALQSGALRLERQLPRREPAEPHPPLLRVEASALHDRW